MESTYGDTATKASIAVNGLKMKMDVASGDKDWNGYMLFHGDSREMIVVNHDNRSYFVIDEEQMKKARWDPSTRPWRPWNRHWPPCPRANERRWRQMMKSRMPDMGDAAGTLRTQKNRRQRQRQWLRLRGLRGLAQRCART